MSFQNGYSGNYTSVYQRCVYETGVWQNTLDEETGIVEINLDFFARQEGDMYRRSNECFCERPYDSAEIQILLERAGMELVTIYDDMTFSPASPENERWVVVAKKMRKETDRRGA